MAAERNCGAAMWSKEMTSQYVRLIVFGATMCGGLATIAAANTARAADFCSDMKRVAAAASSGFGEFRGAQTKQDENKRYYQATGWPQNALSCHIEEDVNLYPKGEMYYVCEFPLTIDDRGKAETLFAKQLANCVGGQSEPMPFTSTNSDSGASTVDAKGFYAFVEANRKSSAIEVSISKPAP